MANLGAKLLLELIVGLGHVVVTARLAVMLRARIVSLKAASARANSYVLSG
jgi:hypothetical protein